MKRENGRLLSHDGKFDLSDLNKLELDYWSQIYPQSGVFYLQGRPGDGKSAILRSLGEKVKVVKTGESLQLFDLRLSMIDETDVGLYPKAVKIMVTINGETYEEDVLKHVVPEWAIMANEKPSLIIFEELNRAQLAQRNAGMQIFLERQIGFKFKLNDGVFMCATGNLGDADGTEVEEFDTALNGRLIHRKHNLGLQEWINYFAKDNIHPIIIKYLSANPGYFYDVSALSNDVDNDSNAYASPRTWTDLSNFITKNYGFDAKIEDFIEPLSNKGQTYIGKSFAKFHSYLIDISKLSVLDIVNRYSELKKEDNFSLYRSRKSEFTNDLKDIDFRELDDNQIENIKLFLLDNNKDESYSLLLHILEKYYDVNINDDNDDKDNIEENISLELENLNKKDLKIIKSFFKEDKRFDWFQTYAFKTIESNENYQKIETEEKTTETT